MGSETEVAYRGVLLKMRALIEQEHENTREALRAIPATRLYVAIAPSINSPGNLALHLAGNLRTLVGLIAGDVPYERDREREFSANTLTHDQTLEELAEGVEVSLRVIDDMLATPEKWNEVAPMAKFEGETRGDHVVRSAMHFTHHVGQIALQSKIHVMLSKAVDS